MQTNQPSHRDKEMAGKTHKGKYDDVVSSFIDEFWKNEFRSPTLREISDHCGMNSVSIARYVIRKIADSRGYVFVGNKNSLHVVPSWVISAIKSAGAI